MSRLILIRGLPGSGKTTLAKAIRSSRSREFAADDYFYKDGEYSFDPSQLPDAHDWCLSQAKSAIADDWDVIVHNTFTQCWEMQPYIYLAQERGYQLFVVSLFDGGLSDEELTERNSHGVPYDAIVRMRARFEHDWKSGNPVAPWMRIP